MFWFYNGIFSQMVKFGEDVERELRTQVIQAREVKPGVFGKDSVLDNNYY